MAVQLILKNSSVEDKRPTANQLANGEISLNYNADGAFLCCRDTFGEIQQIGGVKISDTAPDNPVKQSQWFDPTNLTLFIYNGANWLPIAGGGGGGGGGGTGDITTVIGNDGIDASEIAGVVTLNIDLAGGQDGLEFKSSRLSASTATASRLGSVKIGDGIDVATDGTISVGDSAGLAPDEVLGGDGIKATAGADSVELDVDLAPNKGLEFIGGQLAAEIGTGLQFKPDGSIGIDGDTVLQTGDVTGGDGIKITDGTGTATVDVDLLGGQDGLEIKSDKLTATVATASKLGSVKIGDLINVESNGTISVSPPVISSNVSPAFVEDYIWFDTRTAEAYVGYKDPNNDEYWVSLTKVGLPGQNGSNGSDGKDGADGTDGTDGANGATAVGDSSPASPENGEIWVNTTTGKSYAWWDSQSVWVSM